MWSMRAIRLYAAWSMLLGMLNVLTESGTAEDAAHGHKEEWQSLFNGKDLTGWTVKCKPEDRQKKFWRVDAGTVLADSMGHKDHDYVWLVTDREYKDFIGHVHTAGNPGRKELDETQEINYRGIMLALVELGYSGFVGHEFIPTRDPLEGLREACTLCDV